MSQVVKYPVKVPWPFWVAAVASITSSSVMLGGLVLYSAVSNGWLFAVLVLLVALSHLIPLVLIVRAMRRANIGVSMEGIKFMTAHSFDFIPWVDILEVTSEGERLHIRVRQPKQIPFVRFKRRFTFRMDDAASAFDDIRRRMNQYVPSDSSPMRVDNDPLR